MLNTQIVADIFYVMTQINKELDVERKREKQKVEDLIKKEIQQINPNMKKY